MELDESWVLRAVRELRPQDPRPSRLDDCIGSRASASFLSTRLAASGLRREHSDAGPEAQQPAAQRPVVRDVQRHPQAAVGQLVDLLRLVPDAAADERARPRRRTRPRCARARPRRRPSTDRTASSGSSRVLLERVFRDRQSLDAIDGERAELVVGRAPTPTRYTPPCASASRYGCTA